MQKRNISVASVFMAMMIALAAMVTIGSGELRAQCNTYQVTNTALCAVRIVVGPTTTPTVYIVPAGASISITPPPGASFLGIINACGSITSFTNSCTTSVFSDFGCCVFACLNTAACTITITPAPSPCRC